MVAAWAWGLAGHLGHTLADPLAVALRLRVVRCVRSRPLRRRVIWQAAMRKHFCPCGEGHAQARELVQRSAQTLARLVADVKATTDCQRVVVGGSIGLAPGYLALVRACLALEPSVYQVAMSAALSP
jgi:N-acylmannosamine kinase